MTSRILATILLAATILLTGCDSNRTTEPKGTGSTDSLNSLGENGEAIDSATAEEEPETNCVRGQAAPVIKKTFYPNSTFNLNKDNLTGVETLHFANGDKLTINNWGCEYFVLTFKFETSRFHADTTDIDYWIDKAVVLMTELEDALDAPLDTSGGTRATKNLMEANKAYALGQEIVYNTNDIREFITIDRIQQLDEKKYSLEISYSTGPL